VVTGGARASFVEAAVGADIRDGHPVEDSIDGVTPGVIVEPHTPAGVAATLAWAARQGLSVVIRGGGTKIEWGRRPQSVDVVMSLRRLNRVLEHESGDLTATVEAGTTLGALNQQLSVHGQWLPLDPPFPDRATIGGLLATNDAGPHRHRFGTPRDLVIGIQLATTDGRLTRAGGKVVKNVAGYDLSRFVSGSFGGLAAIVSATFKLSPAPSDARTVLVEARDPTAIAGIAEAITSSQLEPVAFEVHARFPATAPSFACLLRFASSATTVESEVAGAVSLLASRTTSSRVVTGEAEIALWREHQARFWESPGAVLRASWLPADLEATLSMGAHLASSGLVEMIGRVGIGAGLVRIEGDPVRQAAVIERLRASDVVGNVVLLRATPDLKSIVDVWGPRSNSALLDALKQTLDPGGTLGAGRGPL